MTSADILQFIADIAWPGLVAAGLLVFRQEIRGLAQGLGDRTGELQFGPNGLSWKRQVREDRAEVQRELAESREALDVPVAALDSARSRRSPHQRASQRVIEAVTTLEEKLRERTTPQLGRGRRPGIYGLANRAFEEGVFDEAERESAKGLYNVHLAARRSGDDAITPAMADDVDVVVEALLETLDKDGSHQKDSGTKSTVPR